MTTSRLLFCFKFCRLASHTFRGFFISLFIFPWIGKESKKAHVHRWSQRLLAILNVRVHVNVRHPSLSAFLIANHISWLDIFVINSITPCRFVAKSDIRSWPFIGWLCEKAGTIFLTRGSKRDVRRIYYHLVERIEEGDRVAFFPEGTTSTQGTLLPFHANLFEAAIHAKVAVQPVGLRYLTTDGKFHSAVEYTDDVTFMQSLFLILRSDRIDVNIHVAASLSSEGTHRRELAAAASAVMKEALGT